MNENNQFAIKKEEKAGKSIWGVLFIIIFLVIFAICVLKRLNFKEEEATMPLAAVETLTMGVGDIYNEESITGTILPNDTYYVINKTAGEITEIYVKNGDFVKKGDPICEIDNQKQIDAAFYQYDTLKKSFERTEKLYKSGDVSKQNYEQLKAQYDGAKLQYDTQVEFATPVATGDGYIENTDMTLGVTKSQGSILCYITSDEGMEVDFAVSERVLKGIRLGDNVTIEKNRKTYNATIYDKASLIDQKTGLFNIKAKITDENDFASGIMAKVTLYFDESLDTNILPRTCIYYDSERPYVYILDKNNKIVIKNVELGLVTDDEVEILSGIDMNDKIISTWTSELSEGVEVNEVKSSIYEVIEKRARTIETDPIDNIEDEYILSPTPATDSNADLNYNFSEPISDIKNVNGPFLPYIASISTPIDMSPYAVDDENIDKNMVATGSEAYEDDGFTDMKGLPFIEANDIKRSNIEE